MKVVPTGTAPIPLTCRAAGVLLFYQDSVLLAKRCLLFRGEEVPFGGHWSPFTGAIEEGENPLVAAVREVKEESGLELDICDLTYITSIEGHARSLTLYGNELPSLFEPVLDEEHTEYGYFKLTELHKAPTPIDEDILTAIERYVNVLRPSPHT